MLIRRSLITGLLFWIPIGVTLLIIKVVIDLLNAVGNFLLKLMPTDSFVVEFFTKEGPFQNFMIAFFVMALAITIIVFTGLIVASFLGKQIVRLYEAILNRIPLIGTLYRATQQVVQAVLSADGKSFRKVVLVEYPRKGIYSVGFITGACADEVQERTAEETVSVFVPTTPNPTSGFLILVPKSEMTELKMPVEDGIKFIVSLGMVSPNEMAYSNKKLTETEKKVVEAAQQLENSKDKG